MLILDDFRNFKHKGITRSVPILRLPFGLALLSVPEQSESFGCRVP